MIEIPAQLSGEPPRPAVHGNEAGNSLSPEALLAARAIDVLTSLSPDNLARLRAGDDSTYTSQVPRQYLRALAEALDAAYPGALDDTLRRMGEAE